MYFSFREEGSKNKSTAQVVLLWMFFFYRIIFCRGVKQLAAQRKFLVLVMGLL